MVEQANLFTRVKGRIHESEAAVLSQTGDPRDFNSQSRPALVARRRIVKWLKSHPDNNLSLHEIERLMRVTKYQ
jgi:hypothetical protein